jgi:hypothetical protein
MDHDQPEPDPDCTCFVCYEVLLDPVTLACNHTLCMRCLAKVVATASTGAGQRACPMCRGELPYVPPSVNMKLRETVQQRYPGQVRQTLMPNPEEGRCTGMDECQLGSNIGGCGLAAREQQTRWGQAGWRRFGSGRHGG